MNYFEHLDSLPVVRALGWTFLHFIWQGTLLAVVLAGILRAMRGQSANARYVACCIGMLQMMLVPGVTLVYILQSPTPSMAAAAEFFPIRLSITGFWDRFSPALPWLALFWLLGSGFLQARLIWQWWSVQRLRWSGIRPAPTALRRTVNRLRRELRVGRVVRVLESTRARVPLVMGWLSPVILVPTSALTGLSPQQIRMVFAHELAHIRRHDYLINLIQSVFESILFYHPAVWWLSDRVRTEREYSCDDVAVGLCRDPLCYARALSTLDALCDAECQTAVASSGGSLMKRITRIVGVRMEPSHRLGGWLAPVVIIAFMTATVSAMSMLPATAKPVLPDDPASVAAPADKPDEPPAKKKVVADPALIEFKKKTSKLVEQMKADGKSRQEIDDTVKKLQKKFTADQEMKAKQRELEIAYKKKSAALVKKMEKAGKSQKEIDKAVGDLEMEYASMVKKGVKKQLTPEEIAFHKKIDPMTAKMKKDGKSRGAINRFIKMMRKEYEAELARIGIAATVEKMKAAGKSEADIKQFVKDMQKKSVKKKGL